MRKTRDRIRHALLFELTALLAVTPLGSALLHLPAGHFGAVAVVSTTIALLWTFVYNLAFDHAMQRRCGSPRKTAPVRVLHALVFEAGLLCLLVPFIAWYLGLSLWRALTIDASLSAFYLVYAFAFNWLYDIAFPVGGGEIRAWPRSS